MHRRKPDRWNRRNFWTVWCASLGPAKRRCHTWTLPFNSKIRPVLQVSCKCMVEPCNSLGGSKAALANPRWCVWTAQKQVANTFANCWCQIETCLPTVFMPFTHTNLSLQHEFANFGLPCEGNLTPKVHNFQTHQVKSKVVCSSQKFHGWTNSIILANYTFFGKRRKKLPET